MLNPILAQAAAAPEEVTTGGIITGMLFLATAAGSMGMIVVLIIRFSQTGNALPAAQRGVLRVPWPLMAVGVAVSGLFVLLTLLNSISEMYSPTNKVAANTTETAAGETPDKTNPTEQTDLQKSTSDANSKPEGISKSKSSKSSHISPEQMQNSLVTTIVLDLIMLVTFGLIVLVASVAGRVYLKQLPVGPHRTTGNLMAATHHATRATSPGVGFDSRWPDLDDASALPQLPGYHVHGNHAPSASGLYSEPDSPKAAVPTGSFGHSFPDQDSPADLNNPYVIVHEVQSLGSKATPDELAEDTQPVAEPFSFLYELRFAAEVFLAAYLPTAILKIIIAMISMAIYGEEPASHPFLEMLESGVSVSIIATILVMAVFVAPIVEELQFRVVVLGGVAQLGWPRLALFGSSILFAFAHGFPDSLALIPLAIALGYTYLRRRSYVTVMLVHFLFNGFNMILALVALL